MAKNKVAVGAVVGAVVGVVAGVLTAPKSGKETRDEIVTKALDIKDQADLTREKAVGKAEDTALDLKDKVSGASESIKSSLFKRK